MAILLPLHANAAIVINYDNATGDLSLSGSDDGPGLINGGRVFYAWTVANITERAQYEMLFSQIYPAASGTSGGTPVPFFGLARLNATAIGFLVNASTSDGVLALNSLNTTIASGLWSLGDGTFVQVPNSGTTTSNLTINVAVIPEPRTYSAVIGGLALACLIFTRIRQRA